MKKYQKLCIGLSLGFSAATANAAIPVVAIYDNLSLPMDGSAGIPPGWIANEFTTGSNNNNPYQLVDITLKLSVDFGGSLAGDVLSLYTDGGNGLPGTQIPNTTFTNPPGTSVLANNIFTPNNPIFLSPNTNYWVKLDASAPGASNVVWGYTGSGTGGWAFDTLLPGLNGSGTTGPYLMRVDVVAPAGLVAPAGIPIPSAVWLMGSAMIGLVSSWRRKKAG